MNKKIICIVLTIAIVLSISVFAFANTYNYGIFKNEIMEGYNWNNNAYGTSAASVSIGSLTGRYIWGLTGLKNQINGGYKNPRIRMRFGSYGYKGSDGNFSRTLSSYRQEAILRTGYFATDLDFTYGRIVLGQDDTKKIQVSFTSNVPISEIRFYRYNTNNSSVVGATSILQEGRDFTTDGNVYYINFDIAGDNYAWNTFFLEFDLPPYKYVGATSPNWTADTWQFTLNSTSVPFWGKTSVVGSNNSGTNQSTETNVVYDYSKDLEGIYQLISILLDWQQVSFNAEMVQVDELQEANKLLNYCWSMLQILDSDLGIISADVADILNSQYYSPGVTWYQHIYNRLAQIDVDLLAFQQALIPYIDQIEGYIDGIEGNQATIIGILNIMNGHLANIDQSISNIFDWLDNLDLNNNTNTRNFIQSVFQWIVDAFMLITGIFVSVFTTPTLAPISDYNRYSGNAILG